MFPSFQRICELENTRNAWARVYKEGDDNVVEMDDEDYEDYESPIASEDSEYSESNGWTENSNGDDGDYEDEEGSKPVQSESKCKSERKSNEKDGEKKCKSSTAKNVQRKKPRRECPLKGCKADVIDIPRQLKGGS